MRSAITILVRLVFAAEMAGITDASATQSRSIPWTAPRAPTTAPSPGRGPIGQVPTGWWYEPARLYPHRSDETRPGTSCDGVMAGEVRDQAAGFHETLRRLAMKLPP